MRAHRGLTALIALALLAGVGGYLLRLKFEDGMAPPANRCEAVGERSVRLDAEQMANAATIVAVGTRRELPDQAIVIALATALQESKLRNLGHLGYRNDHDSLGLFQQRPSQGWGSAEEILDPRYAAERFYDGLLKVDGWQEMRVTDAAQRVQRSAHPEAYQKWADEAQILADALLGKEVSAINCEGEVSADKSGPAAAQEAAAMLRLDFGPLTPAVQTDQHVLRVPTTDQRKGWQVAHWLVAKSDHTGVTTVRFGDQEWSAKRGEWSATSNVDAAVTAEVQPAS